MNRKKSSTKKLWISSSTICGYFYLFLNLHETSGQTVAFNSESPSLNLTGFKTLIHSGTHVLASQTISHYANYFLICWKWEKLYFSLHLVGHLLLQNDQKFSRAQFIIKMTGFLTCTGENHQFIFPLAASTFILACVLPFLSLKSICPQHALWLLWFWFLLLHNGITASDFKAVSISAFSLYSSWNTTLMDFISLKNLSVQYTFVE